MTAWFEGLGLLEKVFFFTATIGSFLFLIKVALLFVGVGVDVEGDGIDADIDGDFDAHGDGDVDGDIDGHGDGDGDHDHSHDVADVMSFKLLTFQGLSAFGMVFGWIGLGLSRGGLGSILAVLGGSVAGGATVWLADKLFRLFGSLQHSGTMHLRAAVHEEGRVYLGITAAEPGKVQLNVGGRLRVMNAVSEDQSAIPTDSRVKVVNVVNDNVLVVKRL